MQCIFSSGPTSGLPAVCHMKLFVLFVGGEKICWLLANLKFNIQLCAIANEWYNIKQMYLLLATDNFLQ